MKHLFLSGRRMEDAGAVRALFDRSTDTDVLYQELWHKYREGSMDRWLSFHGIEKNEVTLEKLCGYVPSKKQENSTDRLTESSSRSVRLKVDRLRTTSWYASGKELFADGHNWDTTATCNEDLEEAFDVIRKAVEDGFTGVTDVYLCNVREVYKIRPRELSGIHFIGLGQPSLRLECSYQEDINLSQLELSFEGVKLESSAPCFLKGCDGRLKNYESSEMFQMDDLVFMRREFDRITEINTGTELEASFQAFIHEATNQLYAKLEYCFNSENSSGRRESGLGFIKMGEWIDNEFRVLQTDFSITLMKKFNKSYEESLCLCGISKLLFDENSEEDGMAPGREYFDHMLNWIKGRDRGMLKWIRTHMDAFISSESKREMADIFFNYRQRIQQILEDKKQILLSDRGERGVR